MKSNQVLLGVLSELNLCRGSHTAMSCNRFLVLCWTWLHNIDYFRPGLWTLLDSLLCLLHVLTHFHNLWGKVICKYLKQAWHPQNPLVRDIHFGVVQYYPPTPLPSLLTLSTVPHFFASSISQPSFLGQGSFWKNYDSCRIACFSQCLISCYWNAVINYHSYVWKKF